MIRKGIDISRWNGDVDFSKVKNAGYSFVILKAGGSDDDFYEDGNFERNYANAIAAGMEVGAYFFAGQQSITAQMGLEDAEFFAAIIRGKEFTFPVYYDIEAQRPSNKDGTTDAAIKFCSKMEDLGYYVGIYSAKIAGFQERLDVSRLEKYDKWLALWNNNPDEKPDVSGYGFGLWQYTSTNTVPGVSSPHVDCNIAYHDYPTIIRKNGLNNTCVLPHEECADCIYYRKGRA